MTRRPTPLTTDEVVRAARSIIETRGIEACSMRTLATELGIQPPALYRRVSNKDELLTLVLADALADVEVPTAGPWQECMAFLMRRLRTLMRRHPYLLTLYLDGHLRLDDGLTMQKRAIAPLLEAGFDPEAAGSAVTVLSMYTLGMTSIATSLEVDDDALFEFGLALIIDGLAKGDTWTTSKPSSS